MRGVVTLYTQQLQFLFEDCTGIMSSLATVSSDDYHKRRGCHLLNTHQKQTNALSQRVDMNHLQIEENIPHIASGEEYIQMDENEFVVMSTVSDAKPDPRGSLFCSDLGTEGDVRIIPKNIGDRITNHTYLSPPLISSHSSPTTDQYHGKASNKLHPDCIVCETNLDWHRRIKDSRYPVDINDARLQENARQFHHEQRKLLIPMQLCEEGPDTLAMMSKPSHSDDDETKFPLPINVTHDSSVPSPGGQIATKHDGIPQDIKSVRKAFSRGARTLESYFDEEIHISSDDYREWLLDASDLLMHPSWQSAANTENGVDFTDLHAGLFNSNFKMFNSRAQKRTNSAVIELFLQRLNSLRCPFVRRMKKGGSFFANGYLKGCYISSNDITYFRTSSDTHTAAEKDTDAEHGCYATPRSKASEFEKVRMTKGNPILNPDFAGITPIPRDAESMPPADTVDSHDLAEQLKYSEENSASGVRGRRSTEIGQNARNTASVDPDFFGGDFVHDMSSLFTSNGDINWRYNVERQSSGEQKDTREMSLGFNLCELCSYNRFIRKKAARYFYHCLVLLGAGIIEAAQDKCIPYGEIHIRYRRVDSQSI